MTRVVVVGGGFGGLQAALRLSRLPVEVTLVDRRNFHVFQPLVYQVATGSLAPGDIAQPLRAIFRRRRNVRVLMAEVTGFDLAARAVVLADGTALPYDTLVVAAGSRSSYFGHDEWASRAREIKTLEHALGVRADILAAFEAAEMEPDPARRAALLTFVVVGAGPTGVEMAGQLAELARDTLRCDFRSFDPRDARVLLVDGGDRVLPALHPSLSALTERAMRDLGVEVLLGHTVVAVGDGEVTLRTQAGDVRAVPAGPVVWAAGVEASPLARALADAGGADLDRRGRIAVDADLSLPGHPEVLVVGDMARVADLDLPGTAPVAMQEGRHAARVVRDRLRGRPAPPFRYRDRGDMATIGRARAVADLRWIRFGGPAAWLFWLGLHLWYLVGGQARAVVLLRWVHGFLTRGRDARLITGPGMHAIHAAAPTGPAAGTPSATHHRRRYAWRG